MFFRTLAAVSLTLCAGFAVAGATDRSAQSISFMYDDGSFVDMASNWVHISAPGQYTNNQPTGDTLTNHDYQAFALKWQLSEPFSLGLLRDVPYGADLYYPGAGFFQGVSADLGAEAFSLLLGWQASDNLTLVAGVKRQTLNGEVHLPFVNYSLEIPDSTEWGFIMGAAYEEPSLFLRASLDYHAAVDHDYTRIEQGGSGLCPTQRISESTATLPEAINFKFRMGVAENSFVFASTRIAAYEDFKVRSYCLQTSLTSYDRSKDYRIGGGYRFDDRWAGIAYYGWRKSSNINPTSTPLTPTNGNEMIGFGVQYKRQPLQIYAGVTRVWLGDDAVGVGNTHLAAFTDSDAWAYQLKLRYRF